MESLGVEPVGVPDKEPSIVDPSRRQRKTLFWLKLGSSSRSRFRIAKHSAMMKSELAETSGEAGPFRSRASGVWWSCAFLVQSKKGTTSADVAAVAKIAGEARPPGFMKYSATSESEVAESSDEAELVGARPCRKETAEAVTLVPRGRVQQWTVKQIVSWSHEGCVQANTVRARTVFANTVRALCKHGAGI